MSEGRRSSILDGLPDGTDNSRRGRNIRYILRHVLRYTTEYMTVQSVEENVRLIYINIAPEQVEAALQCPVCFERFSLNENVCRLPCGHIFHEGCIVPWLNLHETCAVCTRRVDPVGEFRRHLNEEIVNTLEDLILSNRPTLSAADIEALPLVTITSEHLRSFSRCTICLDDFVLNQHGRQLPCTHLYHKHCITRWLTINGNCPNCRKNVNDKNNSHLENQEREEQTEEENHDRFLRGGRITHARRRTVRPRTSTTGSSAATEDSPTISRRYRSTTRYLRSSSTSNNPAWYLTNGRYFSSPLIESLAAQIRNEANATRVNNDINISPDTEITTGDSSSDSSAVNINNSESSSNQSRQNRR